MRSRRLLLVLLLLTASSCGYERTELDYQREAMLSLDHRVRALERMHYDQGRESGCVPGSQD